MASDWEVVKPSSSDWQQTSAQQPVPEDKLTGIPKTLLDISQGAGGLLQNVGLGVMPDIMARTPAAQLTQKVTGINPALSSQSLQQEQQQPLQTAGGDVLGAASWLGGGALAGVAGKAVPLLTKAGAAARTTKAVEFATAAGKTAKWDDIAQEIRDAVQQRFGNSTEHINAANKLIAQEVPASVGNVITKTPTELLQARRQILARSGTQNIIQKLAGVKNTEDQVAGVARGVISKYVHQLAPGSKIADKAYAMWSRAGGSPAEWAARAAIGGTAGKALKQLGLPESATTDLILTLLAGKII